MTIAITGATGFIGSHTAVCLLGRGYHVRALTRGSKALPAGVEAVPGDLLVAPSEALAAFCEGADVLIHAAGEIRDEARMEALHVDATQRLAGAAAGRIRRWVQLSSTGVYGPLRAGTVTAETPPAPVGPYERTKWQSDEIVRGAAAGGAFEVAVVRPSIVFGADMPNASVRQMLALIRRGLFSFVGKPGASANYIHVADVAEALVLCAERPEAAAGVYPLSSWTTMERFAGALAEGAGARAPTRRLPEALLRVAARLGDAFPWVPLSTGRVDALTGRVRYSTQRIEADLGYAPQAPLEAQVAETARAWARP